MENNIIRYNRIKGCLADAQRKSKWLYENMGVSKNTVSRWVRNEKQPSIAQLYKIADLLNVKVCSLLIENEVEPVAGDLPNAKPAPQPLPDLSTVPLLTRAILTTHELQTNLQLEVDNGHPGFKNEDNGWVVTISEESENGKVQLGIGFFDSNNDKGNFVESETFTPTQLDQAHDYLVSGLKKFEILG